jgi:hypothetical protein
MSTEIKKETKKNTKKKIIINEKLVYKKDYTVIKRQEERRESKG